MVPRTMCQTLLMKMDCPWKVHFFFSKHDSFPTSFVYRISDHFTEIKEMNVHALTRVVKLDSVTAWRIKRCIDPDSDSTKQPWERTGGVPLASSDWDLLETEWDPAQGCSSSPSPCACQTAAMVAATTEGEFACKAIVARGIEQADEVLIADCLTTLGYPSAVSMQVRHEPPQARRSRLSDWGSWVINGQVLGLGVSGRELGRFPVLQHAIRGYVARAARDLCARQAAEAAAPDGD